jgi:hypothetical protein
MATKHALKHLIPARNGQTRKIKDASKKPASNDSSRPFAWIDELNAKMPPEAWDDFPTDSSTNLDHYLYGAPKRTFKPST